MVTKTDILDVYALALAFLEAGRAYEDWAVDRQGQTCAITDAAAARYCLVGALVRACYELRGELNDGCGWLYRPSPMLAATTAGVEAQIAGQLHGMNSAWRLSAWYEGRRGASQGRLRSIRALVSRAARALDSK